MHLISYVESQEGRHFLPPTDWPDGAFTWLCQLDGRHYARVASLDYGKQDPDIDLTVHDLDEETDLAERLDLHAVDRIEARQLRAERYAREMPVGDQLDAILKALNQLRLAGTGLPKDMDALIGTWLAVKRAYPKPDLLPEPEPEPIPDKPESEPGPEPGASEAPEDAVSEMPPRGVGGR